jgi:hypothetical protein
MDMKDYLMKGIGIWLLAIVESTFVFAAYWIGHLINGLSAEFGVFISTIMGASQVLIFLIIKELFKLTEEEVSSRSKRVEPAE